MKVVIVAVIPAGVTETIAMRTICQHC